MIPFNPYNRLKQPLAAQPEAAFNPASGAPQLQWQPNVGGEEQQGADLQAAGQAVGGALDPEGGGMFADYLKKRRAQTSPTLSDADLSSILGGGL